MSDGDSGEVEVQRLMDLHGWSEAEACWALAFERDETAGDVVRSDRPSTKAIELRPTDAPVSFSAADVAAALVVWDADMPEVAGLLDPMLTKAWTYSTETRRYREDASGRFLGPERMLELRDSFTDKQKAKTADLAARVVSGELDGQAWEAEMRSALKTSYLDLYILGRGGRGAMTLRDYLSVARMLKEQHAWLRAFRGDVEDGNLSEAQIAYRSALYHESATQAYERGNAVAAGVPELPAYPGDGTSECMTMCRCNWSIEDTGDSFACAWNLDPACEDHCETCAARAKEWAPLSIPKDGSQPAVNKSLILVKYSPDQTRGPDGRWSRDAGAAEALDGTEGSDA